MPDRGRFPATLAAVALAVLALALAAGLTGALPFAGQSDGDAVVEDVRDRYESAETYTAEVTVNATNGTATETQNLSVAHAAPNSSRLTLEDEGGDVVYGTNGTVAWVYDEANDTARVYPLNGTAWNSTDAGNDTHPANLSTYLEENVSATVVGSETVRGAETTVVRLDPENESREGTTTLWVDDDDRVHRLRTTRGENVTTVEFRGQHFNASIHESTFRPPTDAAVTVAVNERYDSFDAAQAGTDVELRSLDGDYEFVEAATVTRGGATVTTQQYTETGTNATVALAATADSLPYDAENGTSVTVDGADATYVERDEGGAVLWTEGGLTRGVAADVSREELVELAEDVRS
jgi:outer membrane lipoprotein-sorting protein